MNAALKALHDCGVIRAHVGHPGYMALWHADLISWRPTAAPGFIDFSLNQRGKVTASIQFGVSK